MNFKRQGNSQKLEQVFIGNTAAMAIIQRFNSKKKIYRSISSWSVGGLKTIVTGIDLEVETLA